MTSMNIKCCLSDQAFSPCACLEDPSSLTKPIQLFIIGGELIDFRVVVQAASVFVFE